MRQCNTDVNANQLAYYPVCMLTGAWRCAPPSCQLLPAGHICVHVHGDVFRPPANSSLLATFVGTGVQDRKGMEVKGKVVMTEDKGFMCAGFSKGSLAGDTAQPENCDHRFAFPKVPASPPRFVTPRQNRGGGAWQGAWGAALALASPSVPTGREREGEQSQQEQKGAHSALKNPTGACSSSSAEKEVHGPEAVRSSSDNSSNDKDGRRPPSGVDSGVMTAKGAATST
eukprot:1156138-Pelagomonas_calceolata.AAC.16